MPFNFYTPGKTRAMRFIHALDFDTFVGHQGNKLETVSRPLIVVFGRSHGIGQKAVKNPGAVGISEF